MIRWALKPIIFKMLRTELLYYKSSLNVVNRFLETETLSKMTNETNFLLKVKTK